MKEKQTKSAVETAVPKPSAAASLTEAEKQALEISGQIEHTDGPEREALHDDAKELAGRPKRKA